MVSPAAPPSVMSRRGSLGRVVGRLECLVVLAGWMMAAAAWGDGDQPTSAAPVANNPSDRPAEADAEQGRSKAKVGRRIFSDLRLSRPVGIGCISCHDPRTAFADPRVVSPGAVPGRVGTRNAPTLMYAALIPSFAYEDLLTEEGEEIYVWEGGLFHDGRAQDQFEQVQQPFFHANEMNLPNRAVLAGRLRKAKYADEFRKSVGAAAWADDEQLNYHAYRALVEFLKEPLFRPFDARIDDYLKGKKEALNESEKRGLEVFKNAGKCADCHLLAARSWSQPLLSDFGYDNLGAPSRGKKDPGLGGHTENAEELGQFRAPTLRNIEIKCPLPDRSAVEAVLERRGSTFAVDAKNADMADMVMAARIDAARYFQPQFADVVLAVEIGEQGTDLLRHRNRAGRRQPAIIQTGAGDDIADQPDIGGRQAMRPQPAPQTVQIGLPDMSQD